MADCDCYDCRRARSPRGAEEKARALLLSLLTDEQKEEFGKHGRIPVKGGETGNTYTITPGYSQNIYGSEIRSAPRLNCNCPDCVRRQATPRLRSYCYHMNIRSAPYWDHMVAQLLYIKYAESVFLAGAYVT